MVTRRVWLGGFVTLLGTAACGKKEPARQYKLKGKVIRLAPENRIASIQHEEIKGWMEAMTMEFPVPDATEFAKLKPGLEVEATVNVRDLDYWLTDIRVVGSR
jgi:protein SCO1/2